MWDQSGVGEVTTRLEVATFWLPWCVERKQPEKPIRIEREPERREHARQLRVADLDEEAVRVALSNYPRDDGRAVLTAIQSFAADFANHEGRIVVDDAQAFPMDEGAMLHEACHRVCAIYESGIEDFAIRVDVHPLLASWDVYDYPALRQTTV